MITNIRIKESSEELKKLLSKEKNKKAKIRLHIIYLLKTREIIDAKELSKIMKLNSSSITRLLNLYRKGGLKSLLNIKASPGRPSKISNEIIEVLKLKLEAKKEFNSIKDIILWLKSEYSLDFTYRQIHHLVKNKLNTNVNSNSKKVSSIKRKKVKQINK